MSSDLATKSFKTFKIKSRRAPNCYELLVMCTQNHNLPVNTCKFIVKAKPNLTYSNRINLVKVIKSINANLRQPI